MAAVHRVSRWPVPLAQSWAWRICSVADRSSVVALEDAGEDGFGGGLLVGLAAGWGGLRR